MSARHRWGPEEEDQRRFPDQQWARFSRCVVCDLWRASVPDRSARAGWRTFYSEQSDPGARAWVRGAPPCPGDRLLARLREVHGKPSAE